MRKKALRIALETAVLLVIIVVFFLVNEEINSKRDSEFIPRDDKDFYAYQVESIGLDNNDLVIKGWFINLKEVKNVEREISDEDKPSILLYDLEYGSEIDIDGNIKPAYGISSKMEYGNRYDVNEYFKCEYDYSNCGFSARINDFIDRLENKEYQIVFKMNKEDKEGIMSSYYIYDGRLMHVSKSDYMIPDLKGTKLEKVVEEGICVAGYPQYHICVYQYGKRLYWIADNEYFFNENGKTEIGYSIETTQFERLPITRTENGWYWDNLQAYFEKYEILDDFGKYRVCVRDIPLDYSVVIVYSGGYNGGELFWNRTIRLDYSDLFS